MAHHPGARAHQEQILTAVLAGRGANPAELPQLEEGTGLDVVAREGGEGLTGQGQLPEGLRTAADHVLDDELRHLDPSRNDGRLRWRASKGPLSSCSA